MAHGSSGCVVGKHIHPAVQLIEQVHVFLRLVPQKVARPGFGGCHIDQRRIVGAQHASGRVEPPARQVVAAQAGGKHIAARCIRVYRMCIWRSTHNLLHGTHNTIVADVVHRDLVATIRRCKQPLARRVQVDVGHAVGQRGLTQLLQATTRAVNAKGDHTKRLRAQRHVQKLLVFAYHHRHGSTTHRHLGHRRQAAGRAVQLHHRDVLAVGVGNVDPGG